MAKSKTITKLVHPSASLYLTGKDFDPQKLSIELGVNSTRSFKRGDKHPDGEKDRTHSLWMLSSSDEINALDPIMHIQWLLDQLEPAKNKLIDVLQDDSIVAVISCFWAMPSSHENLIIAPELLQQIASFSIKLDLAVFSPDY